MISEVPSKGLVWTNLILGACLACAAIKFAGLPLAAWNAGITGTLIVCCSAVALYRYGAWTEWSNLTLGCWAAIAPFLLGFGSAQRPMWTHVGRSRVAMARNNGREATAHRGCNACLANER